MFEIVISPDEEVRLGEGSRVKEFGTGLKCGHEGNRILVVYLEYDATVFGIGLIRVICGILRKKISREDVFL